MWTANRNPSTKLFQWHGNSNVCRPLCSNMSATRRTRWLLFPVQFWLSMSSRYLVRYGCGLLRYVWTVLANRLWTKFGRHKLLNIGHSFLLLSGSTSRPWPCKKDMIPLPCVDLCAPTCNVPSRPGGCTQPCVAGCDCPETLFYDAAQDKCVEAQDCSPYSQSQL